MLSLPQIKENKILQVGIISGICLLSYILVHFFVRGPILQKREQARKEFEHTHDRLKETEDLIKRFPNPDKALKEIEKRSQELKELGGTARQIPRFIQILATPAKKFNVNIISIKPRQDISADPKSLPPGVEKIYIEIVMSAGYQALAEYTKALSELSTIFIIEKVAMEKNEETLPLETNKPADKAQNKEEELIVTYIVSTYIVVEI